jgi:hypothetical protein
MPPYRTIPSKEEPKNIAYSKVFFATIMQVLESRFIENLGLKPRRSTTALLLNMSIVYKIYARM